MNGIITGVTSNQYIDCKIEWSSVPNIATNTSAVTASLYYKRNDSGNTTSGKGNFSISIGGARKTASSNLVITGEDWVLAMTATVTLAHNVDGTMSVDISATGSLSGTSLGSTQCRGTAKLDTIDRASAPTVSASSVVMGDRVTVYTNRIDDTLVHTLVFSFGGGDVTVATNVLDSYEWVVPDLVYKIYGKTSGICTITCITKSGNGTVGEKTVELTLTIPEHSKPSVPNSTAKMGQDVTIYTNTKSNGYTHKLTYSIGDVSGTIDTQARASKVWKPPVSLAAHTGNQTSAICTITCETYSFSLLVGTATTQIDLSVPDATVPELSASTIDMGSDLTISVQSATEVFTHTLTYALKEYEGSAVIATGDIASNIAGDYVWTVPYSIAAHIPADTRATVTVICETWIGTNLVGTQEASFTAIVPDNAVTKPNVTLSMAPVDGINGLYLAGKSSVRAECSATSDFSTIKSYRITIDGSSTAFNPYTRNLPNPGEVKISGMATDARGFSAEVTETITVFDYARPRITPGNGKDNVVCTRCTVDGIPSPSGSYLLIQIGRKYSKVVADGTQNNFCRLSYQWKTATASDDYYSTPEELLSRTDSYDYADAVLPDVVSSIGTVYNIRLIAEDDLGERDTITVTIPSSFATFHAPPGGHGFTLGGYHHPDKMDVFDCLFDAEFQGNVSGKVLGLGALPEIPSMADANDYTDCGVYSVTTSVENLPSDVPGVLRVWCGNGKEEGQSYISRMQEYIPEDNSASYRRYLRKTLATSSWEYGPWKTLVWQEIQ